MQSAKKLHPDAKFFIATDEQGFIEAAFARYGYDIIYCEQIRSTTKEAPHNMKEIPNYIKGKNALFDCILLSKCRSLIRTTSNLSYASVLFNPSIEVINVNYPDKTNWKKINFYIFF